MHACTVDYVQAAIFNFFFRVECSYKLRFYLLLSNNLINKRTDQENR